MTKVLGLDLGTNSIGWAVVEKSTDSIEERGHWKNKEHYTLEKKGVVIFSEGVKIEKGNESSKAAERTGFRSMRRTYFRRKLRKFETLKVLVEHGMCPLRIEELLLWRNSINPENGKRQTFKRFPESSDFRSWLLTDNLGDQEQRSRKEKNPYFFRAKGLDEVLPKYELGRALYHIAQRRGFLSNRLDSTDTSILENLIPIFQKVLDNAKNLAELNSELEEVYPMEEIDQEEYKDVKKLKRSFDGIIKNNSEGDFNELIAKLDKRLNRKENLGAVKRGISELNDKIENSKHRTLGEYFFHALQDGEKVRTHYTAREEHYLAEFKMLCTAQGLDEKLTRKLERAIFYQRPLKSQKGTVGKCTLEPTKSRCPISHPDFERFRMLSFLNTIKIKTPEDEKFRDLNDNERERAIGKFYRVSHNFPFETIAKELASKNDYAYFKDKEAKTKNYLFNYQMNHSVGACSVSNIMQRILGDDWQTQTLSYTAINGKGDEVGKMVDYKDLWHVLFSFDSYDKLYEYATEKLKLDTSKASAFARSQIKKDYSALSLKAINNINPYLEKKLIYPLAVFMAKLPAIIDRDKWEQNQELLEEEIGNFIKDDKTEGKHIQIANELWSAFKEKHPNQSHAKYELDKIDREDIEAKIFDYYGEKRFGEFEPEKQKDIRDDIENRFLTCLRKKQFAEKKRLETKILNFITDNDLCSDESRLSQLYHPSAIDTYKNAKTDAEGKAYLGDPRTNSVRNPMAMRSLFQLRKLVNTLIAEEVIDRDTTINIELSRELNDANKRKAIQKWQKSLETEREKNRVAIEELYKAETGKSVKVNEDDILRYKLREEQKRICIYTGDTIGLSQIIGSNPKYDFEHTLPRSQSEDNSQMNLTLCENKYNREDKKNRIPYECPNYDEILPRIAHWKERYENLEKQMQAVTRAVKASTTKEAKDSRIEKRHLLRLEYDYYKGKHDRFIMKEIKSGFKNSQKVDIGIISKLSRAYLKSAFDRVVSVKGSVVDEFRKAWGLHELDLDENGNTQYDAHGLPIYKKKDRSRHTHHCEDAVVIACMSRKKYDMLAHVWRLAEEGEHKKARKELTKNKPWKTFTEDVKKIRENTLVYHHTPDNVKKKAKKKWKKRGVVQRNNKGEVIYLKGDSVRGSLHKDTFYGSVLRPEVDKKTGQPILEKDGSQKEKLHYVLRKELAAIPNAGLKHIVDERVRDIAIEGRKQEENFKKEITELEKKLKKAEEHEESPIKEEIAAIKSKIENEVYVMPNKNGSPIPIKKVRCYQPTVTDPIHLKPHLDVSRHEHKQQVHVANDENYVFLIYEGMNKKGKVVRKSSIINMMDTVCTDKTPMKLSDLSLSMSIKKGDLVLFYENHPDELTSLPQSVLLKRFYKVVKFDKNGRLFFRPHLEARPANELNEVYKLDVNEPFEQVRLTADGWNFLVAGDGFNLTRTGEITFNF
ncbi:type II CRISPR RNA-guided endonuclease Cas9 [Owenweeksia hongkongensis]|uniref:type II CRISPR RNA-guided endonuclease Cas9 n=1 Tax=Owenweeksia hongkongensis TaxID=253245 RepID=UPI003A8D430D